jgi:hypothetical protein
VALEFIFDRKSQRYRYKDSGRFLGEQAVRNLTIKSIDQVSQDIGVISNLLLEGKITVKTWEEQTAIALKQLHTQAYLLGKGGIKNMTQSDYGVIGSRLKKQYQYLRGFSNDLINKGMSKAQFKMRIQQYLEASKGTYEEARARSHSNAGFKWEKRIRTKTNSCPPCINFEGLGWQPIGTLPNTGEQCDCRANCGCYKKFSADSLRPTDFLISKRFGWLLRSG